MLVLQLGELDTNWDGTFKMEVLLTECLYEFEKLMLEHVHDLKKDLREKGWWERETSEVSQTTFLRNENSDAV